MSSAPQPAAASFSCHRRPDGTVVCLVRGEIDADSRVGARDAFDLALSLAWKSATIVVDLADMSFCDSTGLNALLLLRAEARARGVEMVLSGPGRRFRRLLETTGTETLWAVHPSLDAAVDAAGVPARGEPGLETKLEPEWEREPRGEAAGGSRP